MQDQPDDRTPRDQEMEATSRPERRSRPVYRWIQGLVHLGVGDLLLKAATHVFSLFGILIVIWLAQTYFRQPSPGSQSNEVPASALTAMPAGPSLASTVPLDLASSGILRRGEHPHQRSRASSTGNHHLHGADRRHGVRHRRSLWSATHDDLRGEL